MLSTYPLIQLDMCHTNSFSLLAGCPCVAPNIKMHLYEKKIFGRWFEVMTVGTADKVALYWYAESSVLTHRSWCGDYTHTHACTQNACTQHSHEHTQPHMHATLTHTHTATHARNTHTHTHMHAHTTRPTHTLTLLGKSLAVAHVLGLSVARAAALLVRRYN